MAQPSAMPYGDCRSSPTANGGTGRATRGRRAWSGTGRSRGKARDGSSSRSAGRTSRQRAGFARRRDRPTCSAASGGIALPTRSGRSSTSPRRAGICIRASIVRSRSEKPRGVCRFSDDFVFPENQPMTSVAKQIGNAVCPALARRVAERLAAHLLASVRTARAAA